MSQCDSVSRLSLRVCTFTYKAAKKIADGRRHVVVRLVDYARIGATPSAGSPPASHLQRGDFVDDSVTHTPLRRHRLHQSVDTFDVVELFGDRP